MAGLDPAIHGLVASSSLDLHCEDCEPEPKQDEAIHFVQTRGIMNHEIVVIASLRSQ
jgi:hypothetical protein